EPGVARGATRRDVLALASVHGDGVAARWIRAACVSRYGQVSSDRCAGHGEREGRGLTGGDRHRLGSTPTHRAVARYSGECDAATPGGEAGEGDTVAVVGSDRLAIRPVHRDRVAIGVEVRTGRAGRDRKVPRGGRARHGEREGRGLTRADCHGLRRAATHAAVGRYPGEYDVVTAGRDPGEGDASAVSGDRLAIRPIHCDRVAVGIEVRAGRARGDLEIA